MSPDSPSPTRQRRAWRFIACVGAVLAAFSLFVSVVLFTRQQSSREDSIRTSCEEQNARHDKTLNTLDRLLLSRVTGREIDPKTDPAVVQLQLNNALAEASPVERLRIKQGRASTKLLIDALAQKRDCEHRVDQLVSK